MKIALYTGSWPQNIGNAFFDLGLEAILRLTVPEAQLFYTGGAVHWMFRRARRNLLGIFNYQKDYSDNSFEIAQFADVDLVAVPGMCISKEFVDSNGKTFVELAKRKIPVVFVGAGALTYTHEELTFYKEFLDSFYKYAIITRDGNTYDLLKKYGFLNIHKGIDCAFFLPDRYTPPKLILPEFNVLNFDGGKEPHDINHHGKLVLRTHHDCWGPLAEQYTREENTLVSDVPFDYLSLYANVNETYSNRVHACIATLAYGNKAQLFAKTPRASLFEEFNASNITKELVQIDSHRLAELKTRQLNAVKQTFNEVL